jgi:hypothetical protein
LLRMIVTSWLSNPIERFLIEDLALLYA